MFNKLNIKSLSLILVILLVIVVIVKVVDNKKGDRSFKKVLVQFDSTKVDFIKITPKAQNESIILKKENNKWLVKLNESFVSADDAIVFDIFNQIIDLKPTRVAATKKERWSEYELEDTTATKVEIQQNGKIVSTLYLGKFDYKQSPQTNQYQRQPRPQFYTYVRINKDDIVYVVEKFLGMTFNRDVNTFRNKTIINSHSENWTKISFKYPADSSFHLIKQNDNWMMNGIMADSVAVQNYFSGNSKLSNSVFTDINTVNLGNALYSVTIEGNNMSPIIIEGFLNPLDNNIIIHSNLNSDAYFNDENKSLFEKVFASPFQFN